MGDMAELYDYLTHEPEPVRLGAPCPDREYGDCDGVMVRRTSRNTGDVFAGCSRFPTCRRTTPLAWDYPEGGSSSPSVCFVCGAPWTKDHPNDCEEWPDEH